MPSSAEVPLAHVRSSEGSVAPIADGVAEDLQAIFPNAPARSSRSRLRIGIGRDGRPAPRTQGRVAAIGAVVAAALGGLSAGALIGRGPAPAVSSPPERTEQVRIVVAPHPDARKIQAALPASRPGPAMAHGLPSLGPLAPPQLVQTSVEAPSPARVVKAKAVKPSKSDGRKVARRPPAPSPASRCRGACDYEDVLKADARLRRAYASAADAGVARPVLVGYRNEWSSLRHRAPRQPARVVTRYSEMARELEGYATRPRVANSRVARASTWRSHTLDGLRADLASLWP